MAVKFSCRVFIILFILGYCLPALFSARMPFKVTAQSCTAPTFQSQAAAWAPNARVTVNINANQFTQAEFDCLKTAFNNWNASSGNGGNQSGVEFNVMIAPTK
jgi:hypothetical protein